MEVISGQYSPVGRQTERSLRRLRTQVEAEEALLLPKTPKAEDSKQNEPDSPKSEKINLERFPWPNSPSKAGKLNRSGTLSSFHLTGSTVATLNGTTGSNGSFEETTNKSEEKDEEASKSLKASVAFSAMGQDAGQLCEVARSKYRRFMLPSRDSRPEAGHYRVNDSCSFQRPPEWDIGQRPLHQGRKVRQKDTGMELGEMYNGFADGLASQGKFQPMSLSPWRPDVTSLCTHPMTFAPAHQKEWCKLDAASSQSTRAPDLVLGGHAPNHDKQSPYRTVPLDEPIECNEVSHAASEEAYPEPHFGRLENGVQVIAVDRQGLCSSLGLYVHTGSRFISKEHAALPHMLELMAFRSSAHLSHLRTQKTLEQLGAAASCRVGREDVLFQMDVLREYVPVALPLMLANVLCPSVLPDEVAEAQQHVVELQQMMEEKPESWVVELLHVAAYKDNTLGHALYATEQDLPLCSPENIQRFIAEECTPDRLTVVGVNVDFQELCKWTARSFAEQGHTHHASQGPRDLQLAKYTGGEIRVARPNPLCHLIFGWEVPGGWNGQWLAAVTVLQMFLGGGGSFSTGGPGKGMHTRLYTEVLNRYHWAESCQASSVMYIDSGLLTVYATVMPQFGSQFHNVLAQIFEGVAKMSNIELERAKNALKSSIHMNLEMRAVMMEDMGRQMVLSGKVGTAQEFTRMVDAITKEDLVEALRVCLKSPVSLVAFGAIEQVSPYEQIAKRFSDVTLR